VSVMLLFRPAGPPAEAVRSTAWWHWVGGPLGALIVHVEGVDTAVQVEQVRELGAELARAHDADRERHCHAFRQGIPESRTGFYSSQYLTNG